MFAGNGHGATTTRATIAATIPADVVDFVGAERLAQIDRWGFIFDERSVTGAYFSCDVFEIFIAMDGEAQFRFKVFDEGRCVVETNDWEDIRAFREDHKREFATPGPYAVAGHSLGAVIAIHEGPDADGAEFVDDRHQHLVARCPLAEDAAQIVRALNAYGPMLAALETLAGVSAADNAPTRIRGIARAAIAKARGGG